MDDILRFSSTVKRDSAIDAWFRKQPVEFGSIAKKWFARMRQCGADVRELLHDGCPVACVTDVPFAYVNVFTRHVNVGFFNRAALSDPTGLLEGTGKYMRHVKLKPGSAVDEAALDDLIEAAYRDGRARGDVMGHGTQVDVGSGRLCVLVAGEARLPNRAPKSLA